MADFENKALDWDSEVDTSSVGETKEFKLLPPGDYTCTVVGFDKGNYGGSDKIPACPEADLTIRIDGGDAGAVEMPYRIFLCEKMIWRATELFYGAGLIEKGAERLPWGKIVGASFKAQIAHRTFKDRTYHDIKRVLAPSEPKKTFKKGMF